MVTEITVIIKDSDRSYRQKFLSYDDTDGAICLSKDDAKLRMMVEESISNFQGDPDSVVVKASYVW